MLHNPTELDDKIRKKNAMINKSQGIQKGAKILVIKMEKHACIATISYEEAIIV